MSFAIVALACAASQPPLASPLALRGGAGAPQPLVDGQGTFVAGTAGALANEVPAGVGLSVVASTGGGSQGRRLLNAIFGTGFDTKVRLGGVDAASAGAWAAASDSLPGCVVIDTEGDQSSGEQRPPADGCKLTSFALELADALIVHSPCVCPTAALVKDEYERIFTHHLSTLSADAEGRTLLVHVADASSALTAAQVRAAAKDAWARAASITDLKGKPFGELFDLELVSVPHGAADSEAYAAEVASIRAKLKELGANAKVPRASQFAEAAGAAWEAAAAALDGQPSEGWLEERYVAAKAYEAGYAEGQASIRKWAPVVAKGKLVHGFGPAAAGMLESSLDTFDRGVSAVGSAGSALLTQRRARLQKALQNDVQELFAKQHRLLTLSTISSYKSQLLRVASRSGNVAEWQLDGLRRTAEKSFDSGVSALVVDGLGGLTRAQLTSAFSKQLTDVTAKFVDSPPMQLQAIAAMRRRTGKGMKPPRGLRFGVGLVGAVRSALGGGQGNLQTFAGYSNGLNSAHIMFANDGLVPDSSGAEPPPFRWQPKLNFDISV